MKKSVIGDILSTTLFTSIFIFILMTIYFAIAFWFFYEKDFNFDLTPTLSAIAFALVSRELVLLFIEHKPRKYVFISTITSFKIRRFYVKIKRLYER